MPVKVRCRSCRKVLNAPDRARGKAIKCPNCEEIVRVPSKDGKQAPRRKAGTQPRKSSAPAVESAIVNVDLKHAEDRRVEVCPKCGAEITEEDIDCPACGIDLATGEVSIRTLRKKGLAVADPTELYGKAWSDSGRFVLDNKHLVFQTAMNWTLMTLLLGGSLAMLGYFIVNYPIVDESRNLEKVFGGKWPVKFFFGIMALLFWAGSLGWYWRMSIEVIRITMAKKKNITKVDFDFFEALALGCKVVFWPIIFLLPLIVVVAVVAVPVLAAQGYRIDQLQNQVQPEQAGIAAGISAGIIYGLCLLMFPVAMVHMSMPYTYKAWLPTEMIKVWAKNIGPALYWLMLFVLVNLPIIGVIVGIALLSNHLEGFFQNTLGSWSTGILAKLGESATEGILFSCVRISLQIFFAIVLVAPICLLAAIPAVFTMRVNGLLAFYCKDRLELIREKSQHEQTGFWVRYLAFLVDLAASVLLLLTPIIIKNFKALMVFGLYFATLLVYFFFYQKYLGGMVGFWIYFGISYPLVFGGFYFILSEASPDQGTIGKQALGMVVLSEKSMKQLTLKQAAIRFFANILTVLPLGIGFVFSAFTPKKQALHDMMAKSVVVFRGDDDATT